VAAILAAKDISSLLLVLRLLLRLSWLILLLL
jgi:hypothetical protein